MHKIMTTIAMGTVQREIRYCLSDGSSGRLAYYAHGRDAESIARMDRNLCFSVDLICRPPKLLTRAQFLARNEELKIYDKFRRVTLRDKIVYGIGDLLRRFN